MKNGKRKGSGPVMGVILSLLVFAALVNGCSSEPKSILVGFSGCLTGKLSDLGTSGRDGVILAVESCNAAGGINGRKVELIVKDDGHDADTVLKVDQELADAGVVAVIGHMTSSMTLRAKPLMEKNGVLMVSPTASSDKLTGLDDNLIRITGASIIQADHLAEYAGKERQLKRMAVVYDLSNKAYTKTLYLAFKERFAQWGGEIVAEVAFASGPEASFSKMVDTLMAAEPDSVLILAGGIDTAMICQQLMKHGSALPVISSAWAKTMELIQNGGRSVEGVIFSQSFNENNREPAYQSFRERFVDRFGHDPGFGAVFGFEAAEVIFTALKQNSDPASLKHTILSIGRFDGLQSDIQFDEFGDTRRQRFLYTVKNGEFALLKEVQ